MSVTPMLATRMVASTCAASKFASTRKEQCRG